VYFWKGGYEAWKSAPYFGHGIGTFSEVILQYRSAEYWVVKSEDLVPHAHNELIETAVDLGGVGIIAYLAIVVTVFVSGLQTWPKQNQRDRLLRIGIFCSLLAILIDNLANVSLRVAPVGATAWLLMGVLASGPNAPVRTTGVRMKKWFAVVPLGAWLLFATWFGSQQWKMYKADGHVLKGFVAGMSNQPGKAASEYQQAVAYDPHNLLARSDLTLTLLRLGRPEEALLSAEQLQGLSPRYPKASLMQAAALVSLKRYSEALRSIDKELELRNHPDAFFYQASAYRGLADSTKEISALKNVLLGSLKGHIAYQGMTISRRLRQLVRTEEDIKQFREIYVQLASMFPSDSTITSTLAEFELRLTRLKQGSKPTSY
jgi:tetratricopeptide (TPR) repeat protein